MAKRDYKKEYKYHGTLKQKRRRALRNKARRKMVRRYGKAKLRGKDIHHLRPSSLSDRHIAVASKATNRGYRRSAKNRNLGLHKRKS